MDDFTHVKQVSITRRKPQTRKQHTTYTIYVMNIDLSISRKCIACVHILFNNSF
jgi:hypothetical protein